MQKLTNYQLKENKLARWVANGQRCELCNLPVKYDPNLVVDHCHKNGWVRGALHRRCNSLLGKLENNAARFGFRDAMQLWAFLEGAAKYLRKNETCHSGLIHPLHKTAEEKRIATNRKAQLKRAAEKKKA